MKIGEILNPVYDEDVGWRPASGGIKPAHVANGLVRATRGEKYNTRALNEFLVWTKKGTVLEERTSEALRERYPGVFDGLGRELDRTRRYARGLLGEAVFPSVEDSSYSLTSGLMVTGDHNDRNLGRFAAALLGDVEDECSLAAAVRRSTDTEAPGDPLTALAWPLLDSASAKGNGSPAARNVAALGKPHNAAFLEQARQAADCLATHEHQQGNHMRTLQRALQFACVATLAHAQALAANGRLDQRRPALLALAGTRRHDVGVASERSFEVIVR